MLWAKEGILSTMLANGVSPTLSGVAAGAGAGVCQVSVMGPCTFVVTAVVTQTPGQKKVTVMETITKTWAAKGVAGFYVSESPRAATAPTPPPRHRAAVPPPPSMPTNRARFSLA